MNINPINHSLNFKRAFSTQEQKKLESLQNQARKELGVTETGAIIFDFNVPSIYGKNYAIGTMNSLAMPKFVEFLKEVSSISKIQASPQGDLQYSKNANQVVYNLSPYSGTTFTLGVQTIALDKLCEDAYANLLDKSYVESLDKKYPDLKIMREYSADYDYVLGQKQNGVLFEALHIAY